MLVGGCSSFPVSWRGGGSSSFSHFPVPAVSHLGRCPTSLTQTSPSRVLDPKFTLALSEPSASLKIAVSAARSVGGGPRSHGAHDMERVSFHRRSSRKNLARVFPSGSSGLRKFLCSHGNSTSQIVCFRHWQLGSSSGEGPSRPLPPLRGCVRSVTTRMTILHIVQRNAFISSPEPNTINHPINSARGRNSKCRLASTAKKMQKALF